MAKVNLGQHFSFYLDTEAGLFILETRSVKPALIVDIPVQKITEIKDVTWDKDKETFEDVSNKKPEKVVVFDKNNKV